jgi:hypothetical protein
VLEKYKLANKNVPLEYIQFQGHGSERGYIKFGKQCVTIQSIVDQILTKRLIVSQGAIEFFCCLVGQDINYLKKISLTHDVKIKAANYIQSFMGVRGIESSFLQKKDKGTGSSLIPLKNKL